MEESEGEVQKRGELMRMYQACKQALKIIGDINMTTTTTPAPPPVKNDWMPPSSGAPIPPR